MRSKTRLSFAKLEATGNDFVLLAGQAPRLTADWRELAIRLCDRRLGIGADGLLVDLETKASGQRRMRIFNADGSEAEMCGNGLRCFAWYLADEGPLVVETRAGVLTGEVTPEGVRVSLPRPTPPSLETLLERTWWRVSLGNPHAVHLVGSVADVDVAGIGQAMQAAVAGGVNAEFVEIVDPHAIRMRVYERGVGETPSCGTGAAAAALAAIAAGSCRSPVRVSLPGGELLVEWDGQTLYQTGPARLVFEGTLG